MVSISLQQPESSHSDVVVAAVSLELAVPLPSKKDHVKTKNSLSGDLTASSVLSSHHDLKPFLKTNEAVPPAAQCPWRPAPLCLGNAPQISSSPPRNSPLHQRNLPAAGLAHLHSSFWPLCNDTKHLTRPSRAISEANVTVQFLFRTTAHRSILHTAVKMEGRDPAEISAVQPQDVQAYLFHKTSAVSQPRICFGLCFAQLQRTQRQRQHCIYRAFFPHLC